MNISNYKKINDNITNTIRSKSIRITRETIFDTIIITNIKNGDNMNIANISIWKRKGFQKKNIIIIVIFLIIILIELPSENIQRKSFIQKRLNIINVKVFVNEGINLVSYINILEFF